MWNYQCLYNFQRSDSLNFYVGTVRTISWLYIIMSVISQVFHFYQPILVCVQWQAIEIYISLSLSLSVLFRQDLKIKILNSRVHLAVPSFLGLGYCRKVNMPKLHDSFCLTRHTRNYVARAFCINAQRRLNEIVEISSRIRCNSSLIKLVEHRSEIPWI